MVGPLWVPENEAELRQALVSGDVRESHWHEFKETVGDERGERSETARDLTSFAIDGGVLIIGVQENKAERTFELAPFELGQRMESLEQVSRSRVDPPLQIRVTEIQSDSDQSLGYLIVRVPASPDAPHMVDGVYWARGDRTRHRLSDVEVRRYHSRRIDDGAAATEPLRKLVQRDPIPNGRNGHLFVVGVPVTARPRLAEEQAWNSNVVRQMMFDAEEALPSALREDSRVIGARYYHRREHGYAWSTWSGRDDDTPWESNTYEIEVHDTGTVTGYSARLAELWPTGFSQQEERVFLDGLLVTEVWRLLLLCADLGRRTGYTGAWDIGIAGRSVRNTTAGSSHGPRPRPWSAQAPTYPVDEFEEIGRVSTADIIEAPGPTVERLIGRILRVVGSTSDVLELLR